MKKIIVTLTAAGIIALGGCNKKAEGQVVAVVNGQEITEQQLNAAINSAQVPENSEKKRVTLNILKRMVERTVLVQQAQKDGVEKSPEYVNRLSAAKDSIALEIYAERLKKSVKTPDAAAVNAFVASNPTMFADRKIFQLDQILFPIAVEKSLLQQLSGVHSMEQLATFLQSNKVPFSRQKGALDTLTLKPEFFKQIMALPAGEPFIVPDAGRFVANTITSVQSAPIPSDKTREVAVQVMGREQLNQLMDTTQKAALASAKIRYRDGMAPLLSDK